LNLLLVTVPAIIGAVGTVVSVYVAGAMRTVKRRTNGEFDELRARVAILEDLLSFSRDSASDVRPRQ
jgi:hypothetical protein